MVTAIYLRKSREDLENEKRTGEIDTLLKHRKLLLEYAKKNNLTIVNIFEEVVTGESIIVRPEMLELLRKIENKCYEGVLCVEISRLGRGDLKDQGVILETFKNSNTKIITLNKTYDLNNEFDEEYSEFETFMSRKEFKMINRRLQRGKLYSINQGNYIGTYPPFGYLKNKGTLISHPEQAEIVKLIFNLYTQNEMGAGAIAAHLNLLGFKTYTGINWNLPAVSSLLRNPVYTGVICWKKTIAKRSKDPTKRREVETKPKSEWIIAPGRHEPLITNEIFEKARAISLERVTPPVGNVKKFNNVFAGLIYCGFCGGHMAYRPVQTQKAHIICTNYCKECKSARFEFVEEAVLEQLNRLYEQVILCPNKPNENLQIYENNLKQVESELLKFEKQKTNLYDLLEQQVYDIDTFMSRSNIISTKIDKAKITIKNIKQTIEDTKREFNLENYINKLKIVIDIYYESINEDRNKMLKTIIEKITYYKSKDQIGKNFQLEIVPKIKGFTPYPSC